jgi:membrane protease YdiL (CAAX protease family)
MLLTDIFAGLSVLSLFLLVVGSQRTSTLEKISLFVFTAFAAATHSATLGVLFGLCVAGWMARPFLRARLPVAGLAQASLTIAAGGVFYAYLRDRSDSIWPVAIAHNAANTLFTIGAASVVARSEAELAYVAGETGLATLASVVIVAAILLARAKVWREEPT